MRCDRRSALPKEIISIDPIRTEGSNPFRSGSLFDSISNKKITRSAFCFMFSYRHLTLKSVFDFGRRRALSVIGKVAIKDIEQPEMQQHVQNACNQLVSLVHLFFSSSYSKY